MKECKYCGTQYEDSLKTCPSCGANAVVTAQEKMEEEELYRKEKENQQRSVAEPQNQMKRLIGILAGVIAIIIAVVSISSYAYNYSPVNGALSRTDMEAAYQQGVAYYESKDYVSAIAELSKVSAESKYYDDAVTMMNDAISIYCDDALSKAATYANSGDYKTACSIIENALQVVPANSPLTTGLASYQESYRNQLRSSTLESIDGYIAENDYPSAIQALRSALEELNGDVELDALLGKYTSEYRDIVISQADAALETSGYEAAIEIANQGLSVLDGDTALLQAIENYETYKPVWLSDLDYFDASDHVSWEVNELEMDNLGNEHNHLFYSTWYYVTRYSIYQTYKISGQYTRLTGVLFQRHTYMTDHENTTLSIYGDNELLWTGTVAGGVEPKTVNINISGVKELRITMSGHALNGSTAIFGDVRLQR